MRVEGRDYRSLWAREDGAVEFIDQTKLPHQFATLTARRWEDLSHAIKSMQVRGAPLIGVAGAYGLAFGLQVDASDSGLERVSLALAHTRPTAINLRARLDEVVAAVLPLPVAERARKAFELAGRIAEEEFTLSVRMAEHGFPLIHRVWNAKGQRDPVQILTHCNAGWLATVDLGTALAPIYKAHDAGIPVHVWVDETRPRNQGYLTAWELGQHGVPFTVIVDNAGGHLMQHGKVDLCIVGTDRTTATGDVCNKIGTYLKALAAFDNRVPFYVAAPGSSIDFALADGVNRVPIELRGEEEVHEVSGRDSHGAVATVRVSPRGATAANLAFDVTPARLVTGLITERGVCPATRDGLKSLFPERAR